MTTLIYGAQPSSTSFDKASTGVRLLYTTSGGKLYGLHSLSGSTADLIISGVLTQVDDIAIDDQQ